ncbi:MAG: hypothetical protein ACM3U2_13675 [Deltaproteobacteria bacterium]
MNINGRLLLLVVATGLFVRVWMVNDRPRARNHPPTRPQIASRMPPPDPATATRPGRVVARPVSLTSALAATREDSLRIPNSAFRIPIPPAAAVEEIWTLTTCPIPLPAGLGSGVYRVVDDTGRVARLEIAPSPAAAQEASASFVTPEFSMTTAGSSRWYFIRLQMPVAVWPIVHSPEAPVSDSATDSATGDERPLCTNRKFDFTGYVDLNWAGAPDPEEIARPEPPDLPVPR